MENAVMEELKTPVNSNRLAIKFPVIKRARTKNLAFLFNIAARIISKNNELVICINFATDKYFLSINEVLYLKKLYSNWLLAYTKGFTNEAPSFVELAKRTGYTYAQIHTALNNKPSRGYTLTYDLLKQWGYIYEG